MDWLHEHPEVKTIRVAAADLSAERAAELDAALEAGLTGYTYLSDEPLG